MYMQTSLVASQHLLYNQYNQYWFTTSDICTYITLSYDIEPLLENSFTEMFSMKCQSFSNIALCIVSI